MPTPRGGGWVKNQKHKYPYPPQGEGGGVS